MNSLIEQLNNGGERFVQFAWPMLWQSSLLILALFALDFLLRKKVRAGVRYVLWLIVILKLLLPPTLALPTSIAWWIRPSPAAKSPAKTFVVTYSVAERLPTVPEVQAPVVTQEFAPTTIALTAKGWLLLASTVISLGLLTWMIRRWWQVTRMVQTASPATDSLRDLVNEAQRMLNMRRSLSLLLTDQPMSPAVCGLFRPVILLPCSLAEQLSANQLRAVLLHEQVHLKRGDVWINCLQALLQIAYWWHPLLWLANARIRRVREEAVDDAVMIALREEAESYAPTLLEVAKLAFHRPVASLGLIGIMEWRNSLRQRVERLLSFRPPRKAGLTITSTFCVLAFAVLAVPMEQAPATSAAQVSTQKGIEPAGHAPVEPSNDNEEVKLRVIVLYKRAAGDAALKRKLAEDIIAKVQSGAKFSEMAAIFSEDRRSHAGGDWGWVQKNNRAGGPVLRKELADVAFLLKPGEVSDIIETPDLICLMLVEDKRSTHNSAPQSSAGKTTLTNGAPKPGEAASTRESLAPTNDTNSSAFLRAFPQSLYENPSGPRVGFRQPAKLLYTVELREDGSYWVTNKQKTLAELRDWFSQTNQGQTVRFSVHTNAPEESKRALRELCQEVGLGEIEKPHAKADGPAGLLTRTYKIDTNTFYRAVQNVGPLPLTQTNTAAAVRAFFTSLGVHLNPESGKSIFYSDGKGLLLVRATKQDLDTIESAIQVINTTPPQINIKAKFVEVPAQVAERLLNMVFTNTPADGTNGFTGILTKPQADKLMAEIKSTKGAEIMSTPEVTTLSGRQAQIQMVDLKTIVTGLTLVITNGLTNLFPQANTLPFGSVLDILPYVSADGYTVQMMLTPTVTEFLGYDDPGSFKPVETPIVAKSAGQAATTTVAADLPSRSQAGQPVAYSTPALPLPKTRVRQITTTANVWDGQTIVLGNFPVKEVAKRQDGTDATKDVSAKSQKQLLVFVTPTIVDQAGNRLHPEEELPFSYEAIPPQKAVK